MNILCKLFGHDMTVVNYKYDKYKENEAICRRCGHKKQRFKKPRNPWPPKLMKRDK